MTRQQRYSKSAKGRQKRAGYRRAYRKTAAGRAAHAKQARRSRTRCKAAVYAAYGNACSCCNEHEVEFLSIDHVLGGGRPDRDGHTGNFYRHVLRQGCPDKYRLLCMNCNHARGRVGGDGLCPHERARRMGG